MSIQIKRKFKTPESSHPELDDLPSGEFFLYKGEVYLKTADGAVEVGDNYIGDFDAYLDPEISVIPLKATITLELETNASKKPSEQD